MRFLLISIYKYLINKITNKRKKQDIGKNVSKMLKSIGYSLEKFYILLKVRIITTFLLIGSTSISSFSLFPTILIIKQCRINRIFDCKYF